MVKFSDRPIHEIELAVPGNSADMLLRRNHLMTIAPEAGGYRVPSLNDLFTIKCSHRFKKNSPFFEKTMRDYHVLKGMGCKVEDKQFLELRERETYTESHPSLMKSKKDFFSGDQVKYVYDHDSIHQAVKQGERPAYDYFKPETTDVMVSRKLFEALPLNIRLNSVLEETYVLALERSQIPHGDRINPEQSFKIALMKVCTSITSGWWRAFAYDHYYTVHNMYRQAGLDDYVDRFEAGLASGVVKPYVV